MIGEVPFDPVVQRALHAAAALLFLSAAGHKLRDPSAFRRALAGYRVLPERAVSSAAAVVVALEFAIAIGCVVPGVAAAACLAGAGLLAAYTLAIAA
ncbi:MAG: MauE/DoxX family redox-associated membrane protein, partial [Myxococcota bacterium]